MPYVFEFNPLTGSLDLVSEEKKTIQAACDPTDSVGEWVYAKRVSNNLEVGKADVSDRSKLPAIGVIIAKHSATQCTIQIDGTFETPLPTTKTPVYLSPSSTATLTPPPSGYLQILGIPTSTNTMLVKPEFLLRKLV